jgi:hypothetical protein
MLHIRTLGASEIRFGGVRVGAEQPLTFALLLLLAVSGGAGYSRRELAATLWPGVPDRDRHHRLRSLLHRLRRLGAPLACVGATVSLHSASIDFRDFITLPDSIDVVRARVASIGAILPGLAASSPALADRVDDVRDLAVGTLTRWLTAAVRLARVAGDWALVEQLTQSAQEVDPANDRVTIDRAEAACLCGDPQRAIALLDELTAHGEADEEILLGAARLRQRIAAHLAASVSVQRTTLVGREAIVRRLWSAVSRAVGGHGGAIVLWGPAGIGKSRLIRELDAVCLTGDARLVRLEARPAYGLHPFTMILDLAGALLDEPGAAGCDPRAYALLARTRSGSLPNDQRGAADAIGEEALRDALAELLAAISDESPTILAIDDMHSVDVGIWRVLRALARWSGDRRLLWIFAYRALHELELASLPEPNIVSRIRVSCLDAAAAESIARETAHSASIDHEQLYDLAGGHPLLLQGVTRSGGALPARLEWVVDDCIARLDAEALRALRLIATLGSATPRALADLGIFTRAELSAVLDELERIGMIREEHGVLRAYGVWAAAALATATRGEHGSLTLAVSRPPAMSER